MDDRSRASHCDIVSFYFTGDVYTSKLSLELALNRFPGRTDTRLVSEHVLHVHSVPISSSKRVQQPGSFLSYPARCITRSQL